MIHFEAVADADEPSASQQEQQNGQVGSLLPCLGSPGSRMRFAVVRVPPTCSTTHLVSGDDRAKELASLQEVNTVLSVRS